MEILRFNDKSYTINLDKLMEWISSSVNGNDNQLQTTVTEVWAKPDTEIINEDDEINDDLDLVSKEMTDVKSDNTAITAKFEIMKDILGVVLDINYNPDGSLKLEDRFTLSEVLCLNTLVNNGIIYEIDENE